MNARRELYGIVLHFGSNAHGGNLARFPASAKPALPSRNGVQSSIERPIRIEIADVRKVHLTARGAASPKREFSVEI
jgi:hypothetical protein